MTDAGRLSDVIGSLLLNHTHGRNAMLTQELVWEFRKFRQIGGVGGGVPAAAQVIGQVEVGRDRGGSMKALQTTGTSRESARADYLRDWARRIDGAAVAGKFGGKAIRITNTQGVNGPRAAALLLYAGFDAGALLRAMPAD